YLFLTTESPPFTIKDDKAIEDNLENMESDLEDNTIGACAPATIPAICPLERNVTHFPKTFPVSIFGTRIKSTLPETGLFIFFERAAFLSIILSSAKGPSIIASDI